VIPVKNTENIDLICHSINLENVTDSLVGTTISNYDNFSSYVNCGTISSHFLKLTLIPSIDGYISFHIPGNVPYIFLNVCLHASLYSIFLFSFKLPPNAHILANIKNFSIESFNTSIVILFLSKSSFNDNFLIEFAYSLINDINKLPLEYICCISIVAIGSAPSTLLTLVLYYVINVGKYVLYNSIV